MLAERGRPKASGTIQFPIALRYRQAPQSHPRSREQSSDAWRIRKRRPPPSPWPSRFGNTIALWRPEHARPSALPPLRPDPSSNSVKSKPPVPKPSGFHSTKPPSCCKCIRKSMFPTSPPTMASFFQEIEGSSCPSGSRARSRTRTNPERRPGGGSLPLRLPAHSSMKCCDLRLRPA